MPQLVESYVEFVERHSIGGKPIKTDTSAAKGQIEVWLFPDGASARSSSYGPITQEPPTAPVELLVAKRRYHATKLQRFESDFGKLKAALAGAYGSGAAEPFQWDATAVKLYGPASGDEVADLIRIRDLVLQERTAIATLDAELEATPEMRRQREREAREAELERVRVKAHADRMEQLNRIEI